MKDIVLKPAVVIAGVVLLFGLTACDLWLMVKSSNQNALIEKAFSPESAGIPKDGQLVPMITGQKLSTGQNWSVVPSASSSIALLIFRESCHFCEENWKNWDHLFGDGKPALSVIFLTEDKTISETYKTKHPLLTKNMVLLGVDPKLLASLKPGFTPQTILVSAGKIDHDWAGLLTSNDVMKLEKVLPRSTD